VTPYSTALRLQGREVDEIRLAIRLEAETLAATADNQRALEHTIVRERAIQQLWHARDAWEAKMRREQERLTTEYRESEARLAALRRQASEAYGKMRAIEEAETRWRSAQEAAEAAAEQAEVDDLSAGRFLKMQRRRSNLS